eukprot:5673726-Lingulodinium_polyedra.AAC.1
MPLSWIVGVHGAARSGRGGVARRAAAGVVARSPGAGACRGPGRRAGVRFWPPYPRGLGPRGHGHGFGAARAPVLQPGRAPP